MKKDIKRTKKGPTLRVRSLWEGTISFGLINIPVTLHTAEQKSTLSFHLLDKHNHARVRYERINELTGKKVAWSDIVKGYEYEKGHYVIIDPEELGKLLPKNGHAIDIDHFLPEKELDWVYYERPYYLAPSKFGTKGYILLRETLKKTRTLAMAKIMLRTHQYLAAILPHGQALVLELLRFPEEIIRNDALPIPRDALKEYPISAQEFTMSERLVKSMMQDWDPERYSDENHDIIMAWIDKKIKGKRIVAPKRAKGPKGDVADFMTLLKNSMKTKQGSQRSNTTNTRRPKRVQTRTQAQSPSRKRSV